MEKDPVCKMDLNPEKAPFSIEYKGRKYYFCGRGCKQRFEEDPEKYLTGEKVDWVKGQ